MTFVNNYMYRIGTNLKVKKGNDKIFVTYLGVRLERKRTFVFDIVCFFSTCNMQKNGCITFEATKEFLCIIMTFAIKCMYQIMHFNYIYNSYHFFVKYFSYRLILSI